MERYHTMKYIYTVLLFLLTPYIVIAQGDAGCVTAKCHADMGTKKFVHGPVGAHICTICHVENPEKKHQFTFAADKEELCFSCHEAKQDMMLENFVHTPVANGNCIGCHDPHQSDYKYNLKGAAKDLCLNCHKPDEFSREFVHGPVAVGDCNACHNPHASENEFQLLAPKEKICYNCHKEKEELMNKKHPHAPAAASCTNCHNPHSNTANYMLPLKTPDLCFKCHQEIESHKESTYQHPPFAEGKCSACHNVHASDYPRLFPQKQETLCLSCHTEMNDYISQQTHKHGPVKEGDCNACHDPHGSENTHILRKYFPPEFYKSYATENYALCFECHNKDIALEPETKTLTNFRNGEKNLHYVHVNKDVKGRSCKACHQVHASSQEKHIRTSVPFGKINWELPITYTKYEDGGRCEVGCHAPKEYHRN